MWIKVYHPAELEKEAGRPKGRKTQATIEKGRPSVRNGHNPVIALGAGPILGIRALAFALLGWESTRKRQRTMLTTGTRLVEADYTDNAIGHHWKGLLL
ncbi:hypothetical protein KM043_017176 [Ampulex compressa]|nr:hypothetical protein KM043_017176 [Ampulex compressa]